MPLDQKQSPTPLPDSLRRQFVALKARLFRVETLLAVAVGISVLAAALLTVFFSDRVWDTPVAVRMVLLVITLAVLLTAGGWWAARWLFWQRDDKALARLIRDRDRRLGDRLLGVVELSSGSERPPEFSEELCRAAIEQVATQSAKEDFAAFVSQHRSRRYGLGSLGLLGLALLPFLLIPQAGLNALLRLFMPAAKVPRWTLVSLHAFPKEIVVPHGEAFEITGQVNYRAFWKPARLRARAAAQTILEQAVTEGETKIKFPAQFQPGAVEIRIGDAREWVQVRPVHRPALASLMAEVSYPEYLHYPGSTVDARSGTITVLEGSSVQLRGEATRELKSLKFTPGESDAISIEPNGQNFATEAVAVEKLPTASFIWQDGFGLTNAQPWRLEVQIEKDVMPAPGFPELFRDTSILETEVLPIKVRAQDDYGVKTIGLLWEKPVEGTNSVVMAELTHETTNHNTRTVEHAFSFSPAVMGIPADSSVEIRSFATDYFPGRERSESPSYRIHVLGTAQHAEMIRQNLESLLVHLEEVTRLEERIAAQTAELSEIGKLDTPEASKKIEELEKAQDQNAQGLQALAEEGMKSLREAMRNPAFSEELLKEWTKNLFQMDKLAAQEMKKASQSLSQAAKSQQNQDQRQKSLQEAAGKQDEILQKLQEMQAKVNSGLDDMQALTLSQRLRKVAGDQKKTEEKLQNNISDTIGLLPKELPGRYQKANDLFATNQQVTQVEAVKLQSEISRFYERTQRPNYGEVSKEMTDAQTADELERIRGLIQDNVGMEAMQNLADWAGKMIAWADKLEPEEEEGDESSSAEGAGGGGGEEDNAALKQLLALLRMREKQANIQGRTRLLNDHITEKETWRDGAVLLAASQGKLNSDITRQAIENPYAILEAPYEDALTAMSDVEELLDQPRTDQVTHSAQDKSVAMLSDLINMLNEQAKRKNNSKQSQSEAANTGEMDFLMQKMGQDGGQGMSQAPQPGRNNNGGTTSQAGNNPSGDMEGGSGNERGSRRSSGVPTDYPTEFREALEGYFRALEAESK